MKSLIKKLVEATGPSGYEDQVRQLVLAEVQPHVDDVRTDALGNLIARKGDKSEGGLTVMLAAHLDEIGVILTHVDEQGFARFTTLGGVFPRNCAGGRVRFLNGVEGVIGMEPHTNLRSVTPVSQMYLDLGADSREDCPVEVGDVAAFVRAFSQVGSRLVSKAMDDRVGVAVLIETLKQLKRTPHQVFGVFTVQEEVGVRGAMAAAYGLDPDLGLSIDVTGTGDTPKSRPYDVRLGEGPAIKIKDAKMISDPAVVHWMIDGAQKAKIPYQREVLVRGSSDARAIQIARAGVPVGSLTIPCRYIHSPSEMVDLNDVQNAFKLLVHLLSKPIKLE